MKLIATLMLCFTFGLWAQKTMDKHLELAAAGIDYLKVDAGAGSLRIVGVEGQSKIIVEARIVVRGSDEDDLETFVERNVTLKLQQKSSNALLKSEINGSRFWGDWGESIEVNLDVTVPKRMTLNIDDGSGPLHVEGIIGNVTIDDGSGSCEVKDITGNLDIEDGSGSLDIRNITGTVRVDDGSGQLDIDNIDGEVVIVDDGSGSIHIDGVTQDVYVGNSGSGSVNISNVKGKVTRRD